MKQYYDVTNRLRHLNNMKHRLRQALGNIGIYLPINASMNQVLFCVHFYYMFNLFGDNNSAWKEKYFPLDGVILGSFVESGLTNPNSNIPKMYKEMADEIGIVVYPGSAEHSEDTILNRGPINYFLGYGGNGEYLNNKIGEMPNNKINTDNILYSTRAMLDRLYSIWTWKKTVVESVRRKRKEDRQTPVVEENALLDDVLNESQREPIYNLPDLKIGDVKLTSKNLYINFSSSWSYQNAINYPYTIYTTLRSGYYSFHIDTNEKMSFDPKNWTYGSTLDIENIRPNTQILLYYGYKYSNNGQVDYSSDFPSYYQQNSFVNNMWSNTKKITMNVSSVKVGQDIHIAYKDKYNGIYRKMKMSTSTYGYLGWKPEIFMYSKATPKAGVGPYDYGRGMLDSPMDHMNLLDNEDFGNLGLTILVPSVVEKFMKEKAPNLRELNNSSTTDPSERFNYYEELRMVNKIRDIETVFLVGIYPVDNDNNIIYKDPIVFQFFSGEQLNDDLGLSFADYRKIKSPTTREKVLLRKYYNIKLGQMFYRNNYSRISTEKKITNITTNFNNNAGKEILESITYESSKVGDVSKNLLYLYGRENYMPYVGKTSLSANQNHNITNPDDNTYIENITLPDTMEYTFKKYGNTKIAIQLYMASNEDNDMPGLDYFKYIKKANGGIIEDSRTNSSEMLVNIPGRYMWLPYRTYNEWIGPTNTRITKNKAYPYKDTDIIDAKIPLPSWSSNDVSNTLGMSYATEPVIIDCNKSNEYNAPWLDKRSAPYVAKVVTEDFDYYQPSGSETYEANYTTMLKGIYIKIPNDLSLYMLNDESVKKYVKRKAQNKEEIVLEDREFYGRIKREKYIRVIKNALLGIAVNYNPSSKPKSESKSPRSFKTDLTTNKLFTSHKHFDIIEYGGELYIRLNGSYFDDLEYAGLGKFGTIKIRLIFRNEFFRSDDPESPLNYKYVPTTGDIQLLREIAGQRIKLYRGGILAHPTDYATKGDRRIERNAFEYTEDILDVSSTKEVAYKHAYTKGVPIFAMDGDTLVSPDGGLPFIFADDNSVYDIISIEMDYPHWQELQVNNIERSPISSMETDTNENSLPIPVNIPDLENFDFLEYNTQENSYTLDYNNFYSDSASISPKLRLHKPDEDKQGTTSTTTGIDFYRMLNFWYTFRPKVKFFNKLGEGSGTNIYIEDYNEWRTRILAENRDYFNKKNMKVSNTSNRKIDLEDVFNIRCYKRQYGPYESDLREIVKNYEKDSNSRNLYNIMKYIILNHTVYIESGNSNNDFVKEKFNINNNKRAKFGGYILDKLLYSDWVFTYRKGDSKKIDDIMRQSANDTALYLFNMWYYTISDARRTYDSRYNNPANGYMTNPSYENIYINENVNYAFERLLTEFMMSKTGASLGNGTYNIYSKDSEETAIPGEKRLIDFKANNNSTLKLAYEKGKKSQVSTNVYNVWNSRIYKGDNRKLDTRNSKAKLRRGFRMGDKTPDNPFMGFSMPATTNPDLVPDYIHLVYCDIYWKDFDTTEHEMIDTEAAIGFSVTPDKNTILGTGGLTYDFTGFIEKYHLDAWRAKGKHVIFRILVDEPTKERHRDCPEYIKGEYYDNKYGKGFSPNFNDSIVKFHYKHAMLALGRWFNEHLDFVKLLYTVEMPLGISGSGYMVSNGIIWHIPSINEVYTDVYGGFVDPRRLIGNDVIRYRLVFSSSVEIIESKDIEQTKEYGWSCNNLGNREYFETWMKYNMYGTDYGTGNRIAGGVFYGGSVYSDFSESNRNKFKGPNRSHKGFSGAIRSDLSMDELMKPENFRELLYEMKTITPMYVIGYVDKEKYPEQYETLMNEMGYKYTITSAVIEDDFLKVYYSNEGKNGIKSIENNTTLSISLKFKNKLKDTNIGVITRGIDRTQSREELNRIREAFDDLGLTKINMGDVKILRTNNLGKNPVVDRPYVSGRQFIVKSAIEEAYGKDMVDDVYLELKLNNIYVDVRYSAIKLANVNRTTEINLTDSGLLHMFISNYESSGKSTDLWFDAMYMNHIKIDDNGWI